MLWIVGPAAGQRVQACWQTKMRRVEEVKDWGEAFTDGVSSWFIHVRAGPASIWIGSHTGSDIDISVHTFFSPYSNV